MQNSSGIVLRKEGEKTVYITGDTVWCRGVREGIGYHPDVIIAYLGHSRGEGMHITMGTEDLERIQSAAPYAKIVCVHMETFENQELTRDALRAYAMQRGFLDQLIIPENGDVIEIS